MHTYTFRYEGRWRTTEEAAATVTEHLHGWAPAEHHDYLSFNWERIRR